MKTKIFIGFSLAFGVMLLWACRDEVPNLWNSGISIEQSEQVAIFNSLLSLTNNSIPEKLLDDSLVFLLLPVEASCPTCRDKTIDSIDTHQYDLNERNFIIISCNGGRKKINSYFKKKNKSLPLIEGKLFLDSINKAFEINLYESQPTLYYTFNRKAYIKIVTQPASIKEDLNRFFKLNAL